MRSGWNPTKSSELLFLSLFFFFFEEHIWGLIREQHEAGVGGGRFTYAVWVQRFGRFIGVV
jgi:hypothetical protein